MNRITKSLKKEPLEKLKELEVILDKWAKNSYRANAIKAIETELKEKKKMLESYLVLHEELKCKTEQAKGYRKEKLKKLLESSEDTLAYWKEQVQKLIMEKENIEKDLKEFEAIRNKVKEIEKSFEKLQKGLTP
jgi:chromosome segregation ATPase